MHFLNCSAFTVSKKVDDKSVRLARIHGHMMSAQHVTKRKYVSQTIWVEGNPTLQERQIAFKCCGKLSTRGVDDNWVFAFRTLCRNLGLLKMVTVLAVSNRIHQASIIIVISSYFVLV